MALYRTTRLMLASVAFLSLAGSAYALDGVDLLKKINGADTMQGGNLSSDGVDVEGSTVTLKNAKFTATGAEPDKALQLGTITMSNVVEDSDGGYVIGEVKFPDVAITEKGSSISATDMTLSGVHVPGDGTKTGIDGMMYYEGMHTGAVTIGKDGKQVFGLKEVNGHMKKRGDGSGFDMDGAIDGMQADLTQVDDPKTKQAITDMNLEHIDASLHGTGSWDIGPGTITVNDYIIDVKDVGKLDIGLSISGYTPDFIKSLRDAVKASETNPNKEEGQQAMGLAMLGLMQQLTLNNVKIRFDDASITKRALDYAGKQQGVSGEQMANSLKGMAPLMLAQLNIPELQNAVSSAINTYLDDPKSLTVAASPDKPVPFPMIVGAAMGAPNTIPKVIGLKVSAND